MEALQEFVTVTRFAPARKRGEVPMALRARRQAHRPPPTGQPVWSPPSGLRDELICEPCRAKIRGEVLERKLPAERAGR